MVLQLTSGQRINADTIHSFGSNLFHSFTSPAEAKGLIGVGDSLHICQILNPWRRRPVWAGGEEKELEGESMKWQIEEGGGKFQAVITE